MSDSNAPAIAETDLSGRRLGDYQLLRRLGRGAMADVYLAEQTSLKRHVAFKILKSELAVDQTYVKRFHMEAQAAASLVHANIVQIHDVGCIDGVHYIAQEYVHGLNLREYVTRNGPLDAKLAVHIMRQVAAALHRASEQGIVHRDIKPENIMLAKSGEVKVADFGLARMIRDAVSTDLTQVGMTMGTPLYMSPEQVEGRPLDGRSDIYSLGVTCYYMLTGKPPFRGDTALSVALQHISAQPPRLETLRSDLHPGLCRIAHQMLAKDADQRFRSARDLLKEIRGLKIDEVDDEEADTSDWNPGVTTSNLRLDATQQLATIMKSQASAAPALRWPHLAMAAAVLAFLLSATVAYMMRPTDLLAGIDPIAVQKLDTAQQQYNYAFYFPSVESWRAVIKYFPENDQVVLPAKEELALIYLMNGNNSLAMALFRELASHRSLRYQTFGLAGQAVLLDYEGKREQSDSVLSDLFVLMGAKQLGPQEFVAVFGQQPSRAETQLMSALGPLMSKSNQEMSAALRQQWEAFVAESLNTADDTVSFPAVDNPDGP